MKFRDFSFGKVRILIIAFTIGLENMIYFGVSYISLGRQYDIIQLLKSKQFHRTLRIFTDYRFL